LRLNFELFSKFQGILFSKLGIKGYAEKALHNDSISVNEKSMFTNRTVGDLLFNGFELSTFEQIESLMPSLKLNPWSISDGVSDFYRKRFIG
jgi:hypothetical protein